MLIVLSTEGGDREDCNVFYATYLFVDCPPADEPKITALVKGLFKTDGPNSNIMVLKEGVDPRADLVFEEQDRVIRFLAAQGYKAHFINPIFVIQDHA